MITLVAVPLALFLAIPLTPAARAQGAGPQIPGRLMSHPPVIDGVVGEDEWKDAASFQGLRDADTNQIAPEGGTFWLGYDQKYIYFAARLIDPHPESIHATEYATNVDLSGTITSSSASIRRGR